MELGLMRILNHATPWDCKLGSGLNDWYGNGSKVLTKGYFLLFYPRKLLMLFIICNIYQTL